MYCNLAWTPPNDNTKLQKNIAYDKVANMALDLFCDMSKIATTDAAQVNGVSGADGEEAGSASALAGLHGAARASKKKWRIPAVVEKGYGIPIAITNCNAIPELGQFKRLGMDPVVNAVWLALHWALEEKTKRLNQLLRNLFWTGPWISC